MSVGDTELLFVMNIPVFEEEMFAVARDRRDAWLESLAPVGE